MTSAEEWREHQQQAYQNAASNSYINEQYRAAQQQMNQHAAYRAVFDKQRSANRLHATKTFVCQLWYNQMDITDMEQRTPDGPWEAVC